MRCAKTLGNGCRGPTGRALRQPTPVELVTCEWPPGLRPSWPPYPPARATGAVAATTFSLSAGLPKQHGGVERSSAEARKVSESRAFPCATQWSGGLMPRLFLAPQTNRNHHLNAVA